MTGTSSKSFFFVPVDLTNTGAHLADKPFHLGKLLFLNISLATITRQTTRKSYPHLVTAYHIYRMKHLKPKVLMKDRN